MGRLEQSPYTLVEPRRTVVLESIRTTCDFRGWILLAAHVRTTHVHAVVEADAEPERVMTDLKAYASRLLNHRKVDTPGRKRWARHGSTRWLWTPKSVSAAIHYVVEEQGPPMTVFRAEDP